MESFSNYGIPSGTNLDKMPYIPPKEKDISKILNYVMVVSLGLIAITSVLTLTYNYNNSKKLTLFPEQICAPVIPQCPTLPNINLPACPPAPECKLSCGSSNITINTTTPIIKVYLNDTN